jgi:hypothetical protein
LLKKAYRLRPSQKKVLDSFVARESSDDSRLETDGKTLRKIGMGREKIAVWRGPTVAIISDESTKFSQTVIRYLIRRVGKKKVTFSYPRPGFEKSLTFESGGDILGQEWKGWIFAILPYKSSREFKGLANIGKWAPNLGGVLFWGSYPHEGKIKYYIDLVEVRPELRRTGVATTLYKYLFRKEGISKRDLESSMKTPEGISFRQRARLAKSLEKE